MCLFPLRQLPAEIRDIVQSEIVGVKELLEDQNIAVASALRSAIRNQDRTDQHRTLANSETDVVILKALSKLNTILGHPSICPDIS